MIRYFFIWVSDLFAGQVDRVAFWTFALVIATLLLWWIAKRQLGGINKVTKADFIKKFSDSFFSDTTRRIIMLFDYNALSFRETEIEYGEDIPTKIFPYFIINEDVVRQLMISSKEQKELLDKKCYSGFEIDDYLLSFFEDIGSFEKKGLINIRDVYDCFDWYIDTIWNNEEVRKYMKRDIENEKDGDDISEDFIYIYGKCKSYRKAKLNGKNMWWWKIKWNLGISRT